VDIEAAGFDVETSGFDMETAGFGMRSAGFDMLTHYDRLQVPADKPSSLSSSAAAVAADLSCHTWYGCQAPHCMFTSTELSQLADHYTSAHTSKLNLILPSLLDIQPDTDTESDSVNDDVNQWPGVACPFAGCGLRIASYPGLVMHHRRVHGKPLPGKQRRAIETVYRARRLMDADRSPEVPATDVPHTTTSAPSSTIVSDSFVCPFGSCDVQCSSRDDLIAHVHLCHEAADIIQPVCKQEKD